MKGLLTLGKGGLTYALSAIAIIGGAVGYAFFNLPLEAALVMVWGGLSTFGIRRAI